VLLDGLTNVGHNFGSNGVLHRSHVLNVVFHSSLQYIGGCLTVILRQFGQIIIQPCSHIESDFSGAHFSPRMTNCNAEISSVKNNLDSSRHRLRRILHSGVPLVSMNKHVSSRMNPWTQNADPTLLRRSKRSKITNFFWATLGIRKPALREFNYRGCKT